MKIGTLNRRVAGGLGAALLALSTGTMGGTRTASAAANQPNKPVPQRQIPGPNILIRQNDLAASSLIEASAEPTKRNCLATALIATCRNLGAQTYKPGYRAMRIYHSIGGVDYVVAASFIPQLGPGKSFSISYPLPFPAEYDEEDDGYWMEVSEGSGPDECPANDSYAEDDPILGHSKKEPIQIQERH